MSANHSQERRGGIFAGAPSEPGRLPFGVTGSLGRCIGRGLLIRVWPGKFNRNTATGIEAQWPASSRSRRTVPFTIVHISN
jgi:hypothetical protein